MQLIKRNRKFLSIAACVAYAAILLLAQLLSARALDFWRVVLCLVFDGALALVFVRQYEKKSEFFPGWLLVILDLLLCELLLQLWTCESFSAERFSVIALFDLAFGMLFGILTTIGKSARTHRIVAAVICALFAVLFFAEYIMWDAYDGAFMGLDIIRTTGGAAAKDFASDITRAVFSELWRLLLMAAPLALYLILGSVRNWGATGSWVWLPRVSLALLCVACFLLGQLGAMTTALANSYENDQFHKDVNTFGLFTAFRLEPQKLHREAEDFLPEQSLSDQPATSDPTEPSEGGETGETDESGETVPVEPIKPFNIMDIDFAALAEEESDEEIAKLHRWVASRPATRTNEYTGLFAGKNLIFICAEGFAKELIDPELTPALYRLATQGIQFTDYYQPAWGGSTSTGEYSCLTGLVPVSSNVIQDTIGKNMYFTMGNRLAAEGYNCFGYHNNSYDYYNRDKTHPNLGYSTWMGMGNGMEEGVDKTWPESDQQMIDFTMDFYMDQQPFHVYYMTVSGHGLYSRTGNMMSYRHFDEVAELDWPETIRCFLAANLEVEYAVEDLLARLEEEGLMDDTVIVLTADHYPYCLTKSTTWGNDRDYLSTLYGYEVKDCFDQDHNALIIWSGCIEGRNITVDTPTYSLDILPTLLNLFGLEYDSRLLVGRDVFSDAEPLVIWNGYSWKTDKGEYNAQTGVFTPAEGVEIEDGYVDRIKNTVANRINFSRGVINCDYYAVLFGDD